MDTEIKNTIELNGKTLDVDIDISDFTIYEKPSSNVEYFGILEDEQRLYVQFKGGACSYVYHQVEPERLTACKEAESIGKFISSQIVAKYIVTRYERKLIKAV